MMVTDKQQKLYPNLDKEALKGVGRRRSKGTEQRSFLGYKNREVVTTQITTTRTAHSKNLDSLRKMGIAAFNWAEEGNNQLTLVMNRDNWDSWETEPATTWDESNQILSVNPPHSFGTWFGMSRQGRVVFHVNPKNNLSPTLRPIDFLLRDMSPWDYAKEWSDKSDLALIMSAGLAYHMIVADINTKSMVYISKRSANESHVHTKEVGFGVHTLCPDGLDIQSPKYLHHLKTFSCEMMDKEVASMKELADRFITYDPYEVEKDNPLDLFGKKSYEITSTTAMAVKRNKEVMFYERFWENGKWDDNDFTFNID